MCTLNALYVKQTQLSVQYLCTHTECNWSVGLRVIHIRVRLHISVNTSKSEDNAFPMPVILKKVVV